MGRKTLNKVQKNFRVAPETQEKLNALAIQLGYIYGGKGAIGEMLDAIAQGDLLVIPKENWEKLNKRG